MSATTCGKGFGDGGCQVRWVSLWGPGRIQSSTLGVRTLAGLESLPSAPPLPHPLSQGWVPLILERGRSAAGAKNPMFQVTAGWIDYPGLGELLGMKGAETIMSSRREMVRMPGRLQGMGHDVACTVFAEKVSLPGTDVYEYDRPFISGAPRDLQKRPIPADV